MKRPPSTFTVLLLSVLVVVLTWILGWVGLQQLVDRQHLSEDFALWFAYSLLLLLLLVAGSILLINRTLVISGWAALAERETQRGRKIVEAAADAIITFDSLGRIESFNAAATKLFGYTPQEVLGQPISMLIVADDSSQIEQLVHDAVPTWDGRVLNNQSMFKGRHKSGNLISIELGVSKIIDDDRKVFVQIIRDLTERRAAERQRRLQYEAALQLGGASDLRQAGPAILQAIGRATGWPVGLLWEVDHQQGLLRCQAVWIAHEQMRPFVQHLGQQIHPPGSDLPGRVWLRRECRWIGNLAGESTLSARPIALDYRLNSALALPIELDKQMLGVLEFYGPHIPEPDAATLNALFPVALQLAQFIRRKQDEAALRLAKETAEAASNAKSEFLSSVSHEVRTPLHGIVGLTEILLSTDLTPKQREYLELVQSSSDTLLALMNDMLDFAKIEASRMTLEAIPFELKPALEPTLKTLAVRAEQRNLHFHWQIGPQVPDWVVGDPLRLQQVLLNLIGNAIKFTPLGEVHFSLDVAAHTSREVVLRGCVRDTGIGIPADQLSLIFEAFSQVDGSRARKYGGTGLGLTIASRLVELMDGRIWVESELTQGSSFHFTVCLGVAEPPRSETQPVAALEDWASPCDDPAVKGKNVLVAEDNPVNRILLQLILEKREHSLTWATTGTAAVKLFSESTYDLILMDVQLPEMDGMEATRQIRAMAREQKRQPIIIGLTAHASVEDRRRCLEAGMTRYIAKPVQPVDLIQTIDDLLRHPPAMHQSGLS
jgi:PAS domain S-box-containing protein